MNKIVIFAITALTSTLMACSSAPTSNHVNYGVPFVNRTLPERMIDEGIEHTVLRNLPNVPGMEHVQNHQMRMAVDSFRREVLLTGEVPTPHISQNVQTMIASMNDVNKIYNYLTVGAPKTQADTLQDNYLKSRILARVVTDRSIKSSQYKLVVRNNTVYLLGYLTQDQQNSILNAIRQTAGVEQVVLLSNLVTYIETNPTPTPYVNTNYGNAYNYTNVGSVGNNIGNFNTLGNVSNVGNVALPTNNVYNNVPNNPYNNANNAINTINNNLNNLNNLNAYGNNAYTPTNNYGQVSPSRPTSSYVQLYSGTNKP